MGFSASPDWIVYYEGGDTFTSLDGGPEDAPRLGVQLVAVKDQEVGRKFVYRGDFYWWSAHHGWLAGDYFGFIDYMLQPGSGKVMLLGRVLPDAAFQSIYKQALEDDRLPSKSAVGRMEKLPGGDAITE